LLKGLTHRHRVNVVTSASKAFATDGEVKPGCLSTLGCLGTLAPATPRRRRDLVLAVQALVPAGGSDHLEGLRAAFSLLYNASSAGGHGGRDGNCRSVIAFITDGNYYKIKLSQFILSVTEFFLLHSS